jgi:methionine synthase II (cobalamin-independent)
VPNGSADREMAKALELDELADPLHGGALEQLAISPQCGFASTVAGNPMTEADERAKLKLVTETAAVIWGRD